MGFNAETVDGASVHIVNKTLEGGGSEQDVLTDVDGRIFHVEPVSGKLIQVGQEDSAEAAQEQEAAAAAAAEPVAEEAAAEPVAEEAAAGDAELYAFETEAAASADAEAALDPLEAGPSAA